MSTVSVIIPNYNHAPFLERRIRSVSGQTFQDTEIIFLDDASTDNSRQVFASLAGNNRIRTVFNEANSGSPFRQWNRGVEMAQGEYIWIAEADDFADCRFLERLVPLLDANPNVGLAYCQSWVIDETDRVVKRADEWAQFQDGRSWASDFINSGQDECARYLVRKCTIPNASAVLFRKSLYTQAGGADETMRWSADWLMWVRILLRSDVAFVAEPLNYFRKHSGSVSAAVGKSRAALVERLRVMEEILQHVPVPSDCRQEACEAVMKAWCAAWLARPRKLSLWDNVPIARTARRVAPALPRQTLERVLRHYLTTKPVLAPLRPVGGRGQRFTFYIRGGVAPAALVVCDSLRRRLPSGAPKA
jgi:hypothetical protein